jgi:hypothetical protein
MKQLLTGHIGPRSVRHCGSGVSGGLVARVVAVLRMQKSARSEMRAQKKTMGSKVPDSCPTRGFKGMSAPARLQCRARRVSETFAHARARLGKQAPTRATPRSP